MTPKEIIARIMDRIVDRPGHNMLASEVVKKLDAAGYAIVPKAPTKKMVEAGNVALENEIDEGWDSCSDGEIYNSYTTVRSTAPHAVYTAMVDAALVDAG